MKSAAVQEGLAISMPVEMIAQLSVFRVFISFHFVSFLSKDYMKLNL